MARLSRAKAPSYPAFLAKIMAPLPADAEAVDDPRFLCVVKHDQRVRWTQGMTLVNLARHEREAASLRHAVARRSGQQEDRMLARYDAAQDAYWRACDVQMRIPAPNRQALNWKKDTRYFHGGSPAWEAAIAADEKRLCKGEVR